VVECRAAITRVQVNVRATDNRSHVLDVKPVLRPLRKRRVQFSRGPIGLIGRQAQMRKDDGAQICEGQQVAPIAGFVGVRRRALPPLPEPAMTMTSKQEPVARASGLNEDANADRRLVASQRKPIGGPCLSAIRQMRYRAALYGVSPAAAARRANG